MWRIEAQRSDQEFYYHASWYYGKLCVVHPEFTLRCQAANAEFCSNIPRQGPEGLEDDFHYAT